MKSQRNIILGIVVILIIGSIWYLQTLKAPVGEGTGNSDIETMSDTEQKAEQYEPAKEISSPDGYINTDGIAIGDLVGKKVILIDFWTYSCINCQRTTPYLNAWYDKYKDKGLEIIGIHTPEFAFERDYNNVKAAVEEFGIKFPVVLDNDFSTWRSYNNRYWPRKYLIDIDGYIVYDHIGEGGYDETEKKIQEALAERVKKLGLNETIDSDMVDVSETTSLASSPETYFGSARNTPLQNGAAQKPGVQELIFDGTAQLNKLYMSGKWNFQNEYATNLEPGAKIIYRFNAKNVFMVAGAQTAARMRISVDGEVITPELAGSDVDSAGLVTVDEERLYKLIEGNDVMEKTIEIEILDPGLEAFTFTFG